MTNQQTDGFVIVQVGRTRTGKTTELKKIIARELKANPSRKLEIYDINCEYKEFYNKPLKKFGEFIEYVATLQKALIVFEEATIFFTARGGLDIVMREKLVRKRHEKNIIILNFHSWGHVPKDILAMTDFLIVRKSNDSEKTVKDRTDNEKVLAAFNKVKDSTDNYFKITVNLYG